MKTTTLKLAAWRLARWTRTCASVTLFCAAAALGLAQSAHAATMSCYWTGSYSHNFVTADNWTGDAISTTDFSNNYNCYFRDMDGATPPFVNFKSALAYRGMFIVATGTEADPFILTAEENGYGVDMTGGKKGPYTKKFHVASDDYTNGRHDAVMWIQRGTYKTSGFIVGGVTYNLKGHVILAPNNADQTITVNANRCASSDSCSIKVQNGSRLDVTNATVNMTGNLEINSGSAVSISGAQALFALKSVTSAGGGALTLDGGATLKAASDGTLIAAADGFGVMVGAGGGTIDAAGYNVTIEEDLDNASGATGKMTFKGGGTVTLAGAINYTGGTTVEAGTVVVVPDVAKRTALGTITVTGLENNICEVVRLSGEGTFSAGDLPANTETVTFSVSLDGKSILAVNGLESPFWIGGSGDLSTAANWSDGVVPTENPTIKWASPITLTNSGGFAPNTLTIPDDSAVVTLAGALTVNCLTNASKLAVASTGSLTVTGDLVGTTDVGYGWGILLYSNEGTVTANRVVGYATVDHTRFNEYESVTANTTPICAKGIVYKNMPSPAQLMHMYLAEARDGFWVVGEDGFTFENTRQSDYTTFAVGNTDNSVVATLFSSADWMLRNSGRPNSWNGDIWVAKNGALVIDTSDYADSSIGHTITLNGRIRTTSDASASAVTIKGCGTVVVNTTGSNSGLTVEEQNTYIASGKTLAVTNSAMLQVNAGKKILGEGTISLAAGTTLALPSNADRTFTTPDIVPVTLPDEGTATIKIDGGKLRNDVDYVLLNSVPAGYAEHLVVTGTALDGRHYRLADDGEGHLVMNVVSPGTVIYIR